MMIPEGPNHLSISPSLSYYCWVLEGDWEPHPVHSSEVPSPGPISELQQ